MHAFQGRTADFGRGTAPRSGGAAAQRNETERFLQIHASEKRHRRDSQRVGARARDATDEISGAEPGRFIELLHRCGLQRKTISKSTRVPDENAGSEPRLKAERSSFSWLWLRCG